MIKRLRIKFVCINMLIVAVMLMVIFGMVFHFTKMDLQEQSMRMMQRISEMAGQPDRMEGAPAEIRLPYFVVVLDRQGAVIATGGEFFGVTEEAEIRQVVQQVRLSEGKTGILEEYNLRYSKQSAPFGDRIVFVDISNEQAVLEGLTKTSLLIGAVSFSVFFVISCLLARWAIKPVETAWNQQRQFVADASHELKTPLTVIMTNAELLQNPGYTDLERRRFADGIATMSRQMRGLVESMLELARVDNGTVRMAFSALDLSELVCESLLLFEPVYFEKSLQLESKVEPELCVRGSREHLRQVVDILLDNGGKYTQPGGTVTVSLHRQGNQCLLAVANPGAQISKADLKNIFKRFYRIDKARSMNQSYGLGLPIAEAIVREHGGKIWAESAGGINAFYVQLPVG